MAIRHDGYETRERILESAARVFAERGYRDATIAQICKAARTNVAAVNYHFGSKGGLYTEVWQRAFQRSLDLYPPDGGLPDEAAAAQRLHALVRSHVHRVLDKGALGHAGQILLMEMTHPTDEVQQVFFDAVKPLVERTIGIIRELLGPDATDREVGLCAMSVVHQCFAFSHKRGKNVPYRELLDKEDFVDELVEHIATFSMAGIEGIKRQNSEHRTQDSGQTG